MLFITILASVSTPLIVLLYPLATVCLKRSKCQFPGIA
jgi:hypothetical protein